MFFITKKNERKQKPTLVFYGGCRAKRAWKGPLSTTENGEK